MYGSYLPLYPQRIVCLTAETTKICYLPGGGEGAGEISCSSVRSPEA